MAEKTEKATPKKLRDARRKGQVAKAQDFPAAFTFIISIATTIVMVPFFYQNLSEFIKGYFRLISAPNIDHVLIEMFYQAFYLIFICSVPVLLTVAFSGVLATFLTVGPVWAPEVFKFDIKKFNMVQNLKSKFKMKTFVELLKSLFKIFVAGYIVYDVMMSSLSTLTRTISLPLLPACSVFLVFLKEVVIKVGLFFICIAILDLIYQKHSFGKEMKMEKFEVKQEYKDTEGDPLIKSKRKQIAQEIAYQEGPSAAAGRAKVVITNPTNLAIALDFDQEFDPCPFIIAMGQGPLAEQIILIAERNNVPITRNIPLAQELWKEGKLYEYIPETVFEPVAAILQWIASLQQAPVTSNS